MQQRKEPKQQSRHSVGFLRGEQTHTSKVNLLTVPKLKSVVKRNAASSDGKGKENLNA